MFALQSVTIILNDGSDFDSHNLSGLNMELTASWNSSYFSCYELNELYERRFGLL